MIKYVNSKTDTEFSHCVYVAPYHMYINTITTVHFRVGNTPVAIIVYHNYKGVMISRENFSIIIRISSTILLSIL